MNNSFELYLNVSGVGTRKLCMIWISQTWKQWNFANTRKWLILPWPSNASKEQCLKKENFIIRTKQSSQQMLKTLKLNCLCNPDMAALEFWSFTKVYWLILNANNIHTFSSYLFALYQMILINCASLSLLQMIFSPTQNGKWLINLLLY